MNIMCVPRLFLTALAASALLLAGALPARAQDSTSAETIYQTDLAASINPEGLMLTLGGFRRWSGPLHPEYGVPSFSNRLGFLLGLSPAYGKASLYDEWQPAVFLQVRLQFDLYRYFGANGALLSFPSAESKFGKHEVDARSGEEESERGRRVLFQPVFTAKAGSVIIRNSTDIAYYRFGGKGPYFLEWEYDTLLKDGDFLINNRSAFLIPTQKGVKSGTLLAGPFYEITHGSRADITRNRAGIQVFWTRPEPIRFFNSPRIYGQIGVNLHDRNRDNEAFVGLGAGFDF